LGNLGCPANQIACRPYGGPIKDIGVFLVASPASDARMGKRTGQIATELEFHQEGER
jgi:hypothetical protein